MNQDATTQNLSAEDLELNQKLGLEVPENEDNKSIWEYYFKLVRYMYRAELVSIENIPRFTEKFVNSVDKEAYLGKLKDYIGEKIDENNILDSIIKQDQIIAKLKEALEVVPADNAAQFIGEIFNGNPPEELLSELGIIVQELPQFSPQEIEILQQARIKEVLDQARRKPLNAKSLPTSPGFNRPFTPDEIGQIVDQFGQNYDQARIQKQAQESAKANQPYIPGRYQVNQAQTNNVGTILEPIAPPNFPRNTTPAPQNYTSDQSQFAQNSIRAVPAKKVISNRPPINSNPVQQNNPGYSPNQQVVSRQQPMGQMPPQMLNQQRQAINNPVYTQQRQNPRPIPVGNYRPGVFNNNGVVNGATGASLQGRSSSQPGNTQPQNSFRQNSSLPHKDNLNLSDLLGG